MKNEDNKFSVSVDGLSFTFNKELTIGEELALIGRRSALCNGQYGSMKFSPDPEEQFGSITANRIATLETHMETPPAKDFTGFVNMDGELMSNIWKEFASKAGLFRGNDGKKDGETKASSKKSSDSGDTTKDS